jgi:prepilin-type N-terminal cleavage/methylation domain-containing protein
MHKKLHAFTLIELLVVIAIVGILTGFIFVSMNGAVNASKDARRKSDLGNISRAIMAYMAQNNNSFPETSTSCTMGSGGTCSNLGTNLAPYLNTIPLDPNGTNYTYSYVSASSKFVLQSTLSNSNVYQFDSSSGFSTLSYASTCVSGGGLTCTETTDGSYVVDKYTLSGTATGTTTWQTPVGVSRVEYLVIGGGGSGGGAAAGGGGAGGFRTGTNFAVSGTLTVTVGAGGPLVIYPGSLNGINGDSSIFSTITASGGGYGGFDSYVGGNGGSGGGGGTGGKSGGSGNLGGYNPVEGYNGGYGNSGLPYSGGGGGGAGGAGGTGGGNGGTGGVGLTSDIIVRGTFLQYAGGGGGGSAQGGSGSASYGGGVGSYPGGKNAGSGIAGTGGGGGGGYNGGAGGAGGSGVVVIRYLHP